MFRAPPYCRGGRGDKICGFFRTRLRKKVNFLGFRRLFGIVFLRFGLFLDYHLTSSFPSLPKIKNGDGGDLINRDDDRGQDDPEDAHIAAEKQDKRGNSDEREEDRGNQQKNGYRSVHCFSIVSEPHPEFQRRACQRGICRFPPLWRGFANSAYETLTPGCCALPARIGRDRLFCYNSSRWAVSSAVEYRSYTPVVTGSIPVPPILSEDADLRFP